MREAGIEHFESHVRPVLANACLRCHDQKQEMEGGLDLSTREGMLAGGSRGPAIDLTNPDASLLLLAVEHKGEPELHMPAEDDPLSTTQIEHLRAWIRDGAKWPSQKGIATSNDKPWSFHPVQNPPVPEARFASWAENAIDRFVEAKWKASDPPSPDADRSVLIRRLFFDLTGLPPTVEESNAFVQASDVDAYERVVDRLLASPRHGEQWARHWFDIVRFAETNGFEHDGPKPEIHRYRDYVIDSFNEDLPYDTFVKEHIAGDLMRHWRRSSDDAFFVTPLASAFWWMGEFLQLSVDQPATLAEQIEGQIDVYGKAFLGLTLSCARCHDHKTDPITMQDYYALAGILASSTNTLREIDVPETRKELEKRAETARLLSAKINSILQDARASDEARKAQLLEASKISRYLLASRELAGRHTDEAACSAIAGRYEIDPIKLKEWGHALEAVQGDPSSPLMTWSLLLKTADDQWQSELKRGMELQSRLKARLETIAGKVMEDFESDDFGSWRVDGLAFGQGPSRDDFGNVDGVQGSRFASSHGGTDKLKGRLVSPHFRVDDDHQFLIVWMAGGKYPGKTCINLIVSGQVMPQMDAFSVTGDNSDSLMPRLIALAPFAGREVRLEVVDDEEGEWGHIIVDRIVFLDSRAMPELEKITEVSPMLNDLFIFSVLSRSPYPLSTFRSEEVPSCSVWAKRFEDRVLAILNEPPSPGDSGNKSMGNEMPGMTSDDSLRRWVSKTPLLDSNPPEKYLSSAAIEELTRLRGQLSKTLDDLNETTLGLMSEDIAGRDIPIQKRGDPHNPGPTAPRGFIRSLDVENSERFTQGSGRIELAEATAAPDNPLFARVIVNRLWHYHFGVGIVPSCDNFGHSGDPVTNPELLDFLAHSLQEGEQRLKQMHRMMVCSKTYRQASRSHLGTPPSLTRLEAESIRDSLLLLSGELDTAMKEPSVLSSESETANRRSIYLTISRNRPVRFLSLFDFPPPNTTVGERRQSIVPTQALTMLNSPWVRKVTRRWAEKLIREWGDSPAVVERAFHEAICRAPSPEEYKVLRALFEAQRDHYEAIGSKEPTIEAMQSLCHAIVNLAEFIFVP